LGWLRLGYNFRLNVFFRCWFLFLYRFDWAIATLSEFNQCSTNRNHITNTTM
tara:strand:- start:82 stop:237 length:156 start_codon:yes stop_codon:yes gene_type:complete